MPFWPSGEVLAKLDELLVGQANLNAKIGVLTVSTQQDAENLAQAITANTAAWEAWATNIEGILTNVENALEDAQQQIANGNTQIDLSDAQTALSQAQTAVGTLPVETDPTQQPPAPNSGS